MNVFLTFEFTKTFELSPTASCVVLKISAYLHILTFHDKEEEQKIFCYQIKEISKTLYQILRGVRQEKVERKI